MGREQLRDKNDQENTHTFLFVCLSKTFCHRPLPFYFNLILYFTHSHYTDRTSSTINRLTIPQRTSSSTSHGINSKGSPYAKSTFLSHLSHLLPSAFLSSTFFGNVKILITNASLLYDKPLHDSLTHTVPYVCVHDRKYGVLDRPEGITDASSAIINSSRYIRCQVVVGDVQGEVKRERRDRRTKGRERARYSETRLLIGTIN